LTHSVDPDVRVDFEPLRPEVIAQGVADIRVFRWHDPRQRLEDRDPYPEPGEQLRQLESDGTRADHDE